MPIRTQQEEQPVLNLTPMIDVVFLLIIFFMVGTKFAEMERKIELEVPAVGQLSALTPAPEKRVINVYQDGQLSFDGQTITLGRLQETLTRARAEYRQLGVLIRGDGVGPYQNVASVIGTCRQAGIEHIELAVRLSETATTISR